MSDNKETCFVIMPFSDTTSEHTETYWTDHFEKFLKPLIEENPNMKAKRLEALRGDILKQIITNLVTSPVAVADLTDKNPNVFWELGVRQSFKHGTITIAEVSTRLPFDISIAGTLFYSPRDHVKMSDFRIRFKNAIKDCLEHSDTPNSHVLETISGRGTLFEVFQRDEALRRLDALISESNHNLETLKDFTKYAEKNLKSSEPKSFPTLRFRFSAIELLIISRYVEETLSFFDSAEICLNWIIAFNEQLNQWHGDPTTNVEDWVLKNSKNFENHINKFKSAIEVAKSRINKVI